MRRIGLYGGSFNPIHFGHVRLARHLLAGAALDEVWLMVSPQNPFKADQQLLPDAQRLHLVQLALKRYPRLRACDYEFRLPKPSYTWNTLQGLRRDCPDCAFTLLIGADNWEAFPRWHRAADILALCDIVVYPRAGSHVSAADLPPNVRLADTPLINISSTDIRRRIAQGQPIGRLVPRAVERAISEQQLYR